MKVIDQAVQKLSDAERVAFSEVWTLITLLLVIPATNATSERSFSALHRVKTYSSGHRKVPDPLPFNANAKRTLNARCTNGERFKNGR